ncbi:polysaccharide biosynthesis tyrosine autokinase [Brevibacterium album]|uniref:polysaccharide biosynthesis tyrosine autokinase n=1 Tax=Brevibacterium album TaxID=417948 RepID=UPI000420F738|nr:polysaccharide biosynthesis tyrosine autokinase [Brevibacterium album]
MPHSPPDDLRPQAGPRQASAWRARRPEGRHSRDETGVLGLSDYLRMVRRHLAMVIVIVVAGLSAAVAAVLVLPPRYEATTELYVSALGDYRNTDDLVRGSEFARKNVESYVRVATSDSVLDPVVEELGLRESGRELAEDVEADADDDTSLVSITVTRPDPGEAAGIATAVGESLTRVVESELEGARAGEAAGLVKLTTVQAAVPPAEPSGPGTLVLLAAGPLAGLVAGVGAAVLRASLDTRIHHPDDIAAVTSVPLVGEIAYDREAKRAPLTVQSREPSARAESFRALRTNLRFLTADRSGGGSVLAFSSGSPGEGKSTTACNLGIALAEAGSRVVLVDGDLRRPSVAEYMGIEGGAGLTDVLIGRCEPEDVLQGWGGREFSVLPSGRVPPNPSELLESPAMAGLLAELRRRFDYVLIDCPPVLLATDATVMGRNADGVLFVAAAGSTRGRALSDGLRAFETAGARVRGVVMSMSQRSASRVYGYRDYSPRPDPRTAPAHLTEPKPPTRWIEHENAEQQ